MDEPLIYNLLKNNVALISFKNDTIELAEKIEISKDFKKRLEEKSTYKLMFQNHNQTENNEIFSIEEQHDNKSKALLEEFKKSPDYQKIEQLVEIKSVTIS
jgi:hypothetical protein